jgi:hypothetical protein
MEEHGGLPKFVQEEFQAYLGCGRLEAGCLELRFHVLGTPSSAEVRDIARRTARRLHRAFQKKGRPSPWDDEHAFVDSGKVDAFSLEEPGLFACYQAAASGVAVSAERAAEPVLRLLVQSPEEPESPADAPRDDQPMAEALGVNLYAKQLVDGRDSGHRCRKPRARVPPGQLAFS